MIRRIIFATGNPGKVKEIDEILKDLGLEVLTMKEAGFDPEILRASLRLLGLPDVVLDTRACRSAGISGVGVHVT